MDLEAITKAFGERMLALLYQRELIIDDVVVYILSQGQTGFGAWFGDRFHDKESEQFVGPSHLKNSLSKTKSMSCPCKTHFSQD